MDYAVPTRLTTDEEWAAMRSAECTFLLDPDDLAKQLSEELAEKERELAALLESDDLQIVALEEELRAEIKALKRALEVAHTRCTEGPERLQRPPRLS
jgi:hypothetical protein